MNEKGPGTTMMSRGRFGPSRAKFLGFRCEPWLIVSACKILSKKDHPLPKLWVVELTDVRAGSMRPVSTLGSRGFRVCWQWGAVAFYAAVFKVLDA